MLRSPLKSLRSALGTDLDLDGRFLWAANAHIALKDLISGSALADRLPELYGQSILIATGDQLTTALALIELDGVARRLVLCPPDLSADHRSYVIAEANVDTVVCDHEPSASMAGDAIRHVVCRPILAPIARPVTSDHRTEWVMLTSGTTGMPKMVVHSLASLTGAIKGRKERDNSVVWGTFYDIRRYGGLQIFFRAILGGASLVLSCADESVSDHLERLGVHGITHLTGTPSHWRRAIINPAARAISPHYVRLSGEIADQAILDSLRAFYPEARVAHAYASTEAGVGFEVNDGLAGFQRHLVDETDGDVEMRVVDDTLRIRSSRTAVHYLGGESAALLDAEGFVDTGDIVELRGDRYHFIGRRGGIINVGGLKVHPEEVEAVINRHPDVRMSLVRSRKNPITGAIVVADVVLTAARDDDATTDRTAVLKREILQSCRDILPQHKVPAAIRFVSSLDVAATGKLARQYA